MELSVNGSEALPKDCQATYSRDRPSNTRVPPSSSSYMPRYLLTSIGAENVRPWSPEDDTNVASTAPPTREFQETAKVPFGETATDGAEALETSGGETADTDGHVTPPSGDAPTLTSAHDPMPHNPVAAVKKTAVTRSWNAAMLGVVCVAPEETATNGPHVLPPSADLTTRTVPEALTSPTNT